MKIRPLHDNIIVKRIEEERKTESGIVIPDSAVEKPNQGEIVAVGKGKICDNVLQPLEVNIGDKVLFGKYAGTTIKIDGEEFLQMRENEIIGVIED